MPSTDYNAWCSPATAKQLKANCAAMNPKIYYTCLFIILNLPLSASAGQPPIHRDQTVSNEVAEKSSEPEQLEPVAVPQPSELAMQFYRSSNWLWVLNVLWGVLLPGVLAFSGFSARLRDTGSATGAILVLHRSACMW